MLWLKCGQVRLRTSPLGPPCVPPEPLLPTPSCL